MYFYLANMGFEPTPTSTAAPSNTETTVIPTETTVIPTRPLCSLKKGVIMAKVYARFLCITRRIGLLCYVVLTQSSIYKEYLDLMDTEAWK